MPYPYSVVQQWIPAPSRRRSGIPLDPGVRFLVAHDTGNPGSTALGNARYYASTPNEASVSAHLFVDDTMIVESVPSLTAAPEKAWHVLYGVDTDDRLYGVDANDAAIGVEYCYGGSIDADEAYRRYVWVLAHLCREHGLDASRSIAGHFILDPHRKTDPVTGLAHSRRTYEQLLRDVAAEVAAPGARKVAVRPEQPAEGTLRTVVRLNLRQGAPARTAPISRTLVAGTLIRSVAARDDGEPVNGNSRWYRTSAEEWFWSGGVVPA